MEKKDLKNGLQKQESFSKIQKLLQIKRVEEEIIEEKKIYPFFAPYAEVLLLKGYEDKSDVLREGVLLVPIDSGLSRSEGNQTGEGLPNEEWTQVELPIDEYTCYFIRSDHLKETKESLEKHAIRLLIMEKELETRKFKKYPGFDNTK